MSGVVKAIWLEPIGLFRYALRRYSRAKGGCSAGVYHDARVEIGEHNADFAPERRNGRPIAGAVAWPRDDSRWPVKCSRCEYLFLPDDSWFFDIDQLYRRSDDGSVCTIPTAPIGAIWNAGWLADNPEWCGPDGRSLYARCPGGNDWGIDTRASNCDSPCKHCATPYHAHKGITSFQPGGHAYEDARPHKCWVRHGEPPEIHVDKNGVTCGAGAGSIQTSNWHGFLHHGYFRP